MPKRDATTETLHTAYETVSIKGVVNSCLEDVFVQSILFVSLRRRISNSPTPKTSASGKTFVGTDNFFCFFFKKRFVFCMHESKEVISLLVANILTPGCTECAASFSVILIQLLLLLSLFNFRGIYNLSTRFVAGMSAHVHILKCNNKKCWLCTLTFSVYRRLLILNQTGSRGVCESD